MRDDTKVAIRSKNWAQCFETFYPHILRMLVISLDVGPWQAFPP
jgi:hypothetical protein